MPATFLFEVSDIIDLIVLADRVFDARFPGFGMVDKNVERMTCSAVDRLSSSDQRIRKPTVVSYKHGVGLNLVLYIRNDERCEEYWLDGQDNI